MKGWRLFYACLSSAGLWILALVCVGIFFAFFAWLAYPESFRTLVGLMAFVTLIAIILPLAALFIRQKRLEAAFNDFAAEPDEKREYLLSQVAPLTLQPYIHELGKLLRANQAAINERMIQLSDYENYIESWVHEIKKPLSLMTLVLDNRSDEMSLLVQQRMHHARDQMRNDVEQILYFARLGAVHKDYIFERLALLDICKEVAEEYRTLLEEAHFTVGFSGEELEVVSDRKGLAFILGQITSNSVKYAGKSRVNPVIQFETKVDQVLGQIILHIRDNGPGVPPADLPFIFDKGFTGERGEDLGRATGMGLFLARRMAQDLALGLEAKSDPDAGLSLSLIFPDVK